MFFVRFLPVRWICVLWPVGACLIAAGIVAGDCQSLTAGEWRAGVARVKITPERPMWMSGYASRDHAAEGTLIDLWAKAIVVEDPQGERGVLVTLDLVGIDRDFSKAVTDALRERYQLERRQVALSVSHTHTGPVVGRTLMAMYFLDETNRQLVADYTADLETKLVALVGQALETLEPVRIAWGSGHSSIAVNRRTNVEKDVPEVRTRGALKGPVDHDVPVLSIRTPEGALRGIVFGYACHATVLGTYEWSGDYPGFAQLELEKEHPGATALFFAGCGADQNPLPRRTVDFAREYGRSLARSVEGVLSAPMQPVTGNLATRYAEVSVALDRLPSRADLEKQAQAADRYVAQRARHLLLQLDAGKPLAADYPYPIQVWQVGSGLTWVTLGGEVVVDYALRLKRELGRDRTWIAAYCNDVMAYIPSLRVLREKGYEGESSMIYYGLPTVWGPDIEETIIRGVQKLAESR
jgi:neutral ceramidase